MIVQFDRTKGTLQNVNPDGSLGVVLATGVWSGHGDHANVIADEGLKSEGPLPAGDFHVAQPVDSQHLGPFVMALTQTSGETFGRGSFFVHGAAQNDRFHASSDGCVIATHADRVRLNTELGRVTDQRVLRVV